MADDRPYSMLRRAKELFGLSDDELAQIIGRSRPHVQCVVRGEQSGKPYPEYLDGRQIRALLDYCRLIRDQAIEGVAELELMG
jgi:hypothetical protein